MFAELPELLQRNEQALKRRRLSTPLRMLMIMTLLSIVCIAIITSIVTAGLAQISAAGGVFRANLADDPPFVPSVTPPPYSVAGTPTIGPSFIDTVLSGEGSPAYHTGNALYQLGVKYRIDPMYALAFFRHESHFGLYGVAQETLALGNIRCTPGYRCLQGYRAYASWSAGYEDWYQLIRNEYIDQWHLITIEQIIPVYAPASENDTQNYIASLKSYIITWRGELP